MYVKLYRSLKIDRSLVSAVQQLSRVETRVESWDGKEESTQQDRISKNETTNAINRMRLECVNGHNTSMRIRV